MTQCIFHVRTLFTASDIIGRPITQLWHDLIKTVQHIKLIKIVQHIFLGGHSRAQSHKSQGIHYRLETIAIGIMATHRIVLSPQSRAQKLSNSRGILP